MGSFDIFLHFRRTQVKDCVAPKEARVERAESWAWRDHMIRNDIDDSILCDSCDRDRTI